jgi:hypothetical protein
MLKTGRYGWGLVLFCTLILGGCGYYFPHVYEGVHKVIYMPTWQNRTNKLGLDMKIYQSLAHWFQKSEAVDLTKEQNGADLILVGEILSINLPSVSWNTVSDATATEVQLYVRYVLKDSKSGKILWEVPNKLYTADYTVKTATSAADDAALAKIIDDMSEDIYLGALHKIRKQQTQQAQSAN